MRRIALAATLVAGWGLAGPSTVIPAYAGVPLVADTRPGTVLGDDALLILERPDG